MTYHIDIQQAVTEPIPISNEELISLASMALKEHREDAELTIRLVSCDEVTHLNAQYRMQNKPTNVLAFPSSIPDHIELDCPFLGDVIICPDVLLNESLQLKKSLQEHWALIVIHGVLHLLGYDHISDDEATLMQSIEIKLLATLGYANPYDPEEKNLE